MVCLFRYISTIYRNTVKYLDSNFDDIGLGCNQQFFLTYINETQGITMFDLAKLGNFNKGTITKAVKKLIESGYVKEESDERDKRAKHLFVTEKAEIILDEIYDRRTYWEKAIEEDAVKCLRIYLLFIFCSGFPIVSTNYFQATEQALKASILSMLRQLILLIPLILILPLFFGLDGVLYAAPAADILAAVIILFFMIPEMKRLDRRE